MRPSKETELWRWHGLPWTRYAEELSAAERLSRHKSACCSRGKELMSSHPSQFNSSSDLAFLSSNHDRPKAAILASHKMHSGVSFLASGLRSEHSSPPRSSPDGTGNNNHCGVVEERTRKTLSLAMHDQGQHVRHPFTKRLSPRRSVG